MGGAVCIGIGSVSLSRPCLVNIRRRSTSWHAEHMKEWCSKPGTGMVSSRTTLIKIISAPHAIQRIACTHLQNGHINRLCWHYRRIH
jgi:hypothetical protein